MTTTCLAIIARDEEDRIGRALESALPVVDSWFLLDTGSTDRTAEIANQVGGVKFGIIEQHEWGGFGDARTTALHRSARFADYVLMLDADMTVEGDLGDLGDADVYDVKIVEGGTSYRLPFLTRARLDFRYRGVVHEYLDTDLPFTRRDLDSLVIRHHADGTSRPAKYRRDAALLREAINADPSDSRSVFYLAQTLRDAGRVLPARKLYEQRSTMGGWEEERWFAQYRAATLTPPSQRWRPLTLAMLARPSRPEPYADLAALARDLGAWDEAYGASDLGLALPRCTDRLFVAEWLHDWGFRFWRACAGYHLTRLGADWAADEFDRLLEAGVLPSEWADACLRNLQLCRP